jgi:hypothetical protein
MAARDAIHDEHGMRYMAARDAMHGGTGCGIYPCIASRVLCIIKSTTYVFSPAALIWFLISF